MATTIAELEERLAKVNAAIDRLLTHGQQWMQGSRQQMEAHLGQLRQERAYLEERIARMKRGGIVARRVSPRV